MMGSIDPSDPPLCSAVFQQFEPVKQLHPANCPLDSVPAHLLKDVFNTVGSSILSLVNASLRSGCVPAAFEHVTVQPHLKNRNLDTSVLSNFRPISKLPFLSKVLEKVIFNQLKILLDDFSI